MEYKNKLIVSPHKYNLIIAKPYYCVPAVLQMIAEIYPTTTDLTQEEIARIFIVKQPLDNNDIKTNDYGVQITASKINTFIERFKLPLLEEYLSIFMILEWDFARILTEMIMSGRHIMVAFSYGELYGSSEKDIGHVSLITAIEDQNNVVMLDPGPDRPGEKIVSLYDLYRAIHYKKAGLQTFIYNE